MLRTFEFGGLQWPVSLAAPYAILYLKLRSDFGYEPLVEYFVDWRKGISFWAKNESLFGERYQVRAVVRTKDLHVIAQHMNQEEDNYVFSWEEAALDHFEPNIPEIKEKRRWEK